MYSYQIDENIQVALSQPESARELFNLIQKNREFLSQWLPWVNAVQHEDDTKKYLESELLKFNEGTAVHQTIFYQNQIAGVLGYNLLDKNNKIGYAGYWLGIEFNGLGIMTKSVKNLINIGFQSLGLQKVEIRCAVNNTQSRAIPERLGFANEGILLEAEKVNNRFLDHVIYGLSKNYNEK